MSSSSFSEAFSDWYTNDIWLCQKIIRIHQSEKKSLEQAVCSLLYETKSRVAESEENFRFQLRLFQNFRFRLRSTPPVNNFVATSNQWKSWYTAKSICFKESFKRNCTISTGIPIFRSVMQNDSIGFTESESNKKIQLRQRFRFLVFLGIRLRPKTSESLRLRSCTPQPCKKYTNCFVAIKSDFVFSSIDTTNIQETLQSTNAGLLQII